MGNTPQPGRHSRQMALLNRGRAHETQTPLSADKLNRRTRWFYASYLVMGRNIDTEFCLDLVLFLTRRRYQIQPSPVLARLDFIDHDVLRASAGISQHLHPYTVEGNAKSNGAADRNPTASMDFMIVMQGQVLFGTQLFVGRIQDLAVCHTSQRRCAPA